LAFLNEIRDQKSGVGNYLRAIGLYYRFASRSELSIFAGNLRKQKISSGRKSFALNDFRGIDRVYVTMLAKEGITNANQMLETGKTPASRQELSNKTGVPVKALLELVKLSDLSRIEGVKGIRARLYYDAGVDTVEKMATWNPQALRLHMAKFVERTRFQGIPPLPKEVKFTIGIAKKLPKLVEY
jgi:hypothetical protein